ncbi:MAG: mannose-6-phosphate isomerase, class I [Kineosporiaceae bacterium]|nr:mannose-6-phosphate isomerase, class I [Aeromicrobium sp.]
MHLLDNVSQAYEWGSTAAIPSFLRRNADGNPVAEVWMGTHPLAPSALGDGPVTGTLLVDTAGDLPFLLKVLAAAKPLSLQVHPGLALAQAGFLEEEAAGVPIDAPTRSYKDPNHKPEMAYALTTFDTLVGFRPTAEILRILAAIDTPLAKSLGEDLRARPGFKGIVRLVERMLTESVNPGDVGDVVDACHVLAESGIDIKRAYVTAVDIAAHFPGDVGVVISLFLNHLTLQPGEAAFLGAGVIHAHLSGMCLEVMASSDNVLRAGLTTKHINPEDLVRCLDKGMSRVARVTPEPWGFSTEVFSPDVDEFALSVTQCSYAEPDGTLLPSNGRRILVCTGGEVTLANELGERRNMQRGDAVYAGPEDGSLRIIGIGEVAQAYEPTQLSRQSAMVDLV